MKRISIVLLSFLSLFFFSPESQAQWKSWSWQKLTLPGAYAKNYFLGIYFLPSNPKIGWVCGYDGAVLRTLDGGNTWTGMTIQNAPQLESIIFLNDKVGYCSGTSQFISGNGGIYRSVDGGASWTEITPIIQVNGVVQRANVWGCNFIDENVGLVVGGGCGSELQMFFRTEDGGSSWSLYTDAQPSTGLSHVKMFSANGTCYASSSGRIWRSDDGGKKWRVVSTTGPAYWQENLKIFNKSICVATAGTSCYGGLEPVGDMRFSSDMGATWKVRPNQAAMFGTFLVNDSTAWAVGYSSGNDRSVLRTSDYGDTWTAYRCGIEPGSNFDDLYFVNDTLGYIVGDGIYRTVPPLPVPNVTIQGDTVFCKGDSVVLTAPPGFSEYRWSNGVIAQSITVKTSGEYFVVVRRNYDCSSVPASIRVRVLPSPEPGLLSSKANKHLCYQDSLVVRVNGKFPSVKWSTGETSDSIVVRSAGRYSVEVVDANGCRGLDSIDITGGQKIIPKISSGPLTRFCEGDSIRLTAEDGFASYLWSNNATTNSINVVASGAYSVMVQDSFGCVWQSDTVRITVDPNPISIVNTGNQYFFIDSTRAGEMTCDSILIRNIGVDTLNISPVHLLRNIEFSAPQSQFDIKILPQQTKGVRICYKPTELYEQRDTMIIGDYCHRVLFLVSAGVPNNYVSTTRCDIPVVATTQIIGTIGLNIYPPTPNPSSTEMVQRVVSARDNSIERVDLSSMVGQIVGTARLESRALNTGKSQTAMTQTDAIFDLSSVPDGMYLIRIVSERGTVCQLCLVRH